ncbi:MAG: hypothetical protein A2W25_15165 [candidate division Zixibacteria bacterium RBG_16_53_22]|nr:MAG: hypothetical protein A2W25_15165 [candidate division Zixibacteria bacterium RBG_16_53_22]
MNIDKMIYQVRNWRAHWRAFYLGAYVAIDGIVARLFGYDRVVFEGRVDAVILRGNGNRVDLGCLGRRVVTTAFVNYLRDDLANAAGGADVSTFKYHECGTNSTAEAIGDTALIAPCTTVLNPDSTRAVGTQVNSVAKTYSSVGTLTFDGSAAVVEHGIFNAAATGTLLDRTVFAAINVANGDSIQFTYTLTISDGG